MWGIPTIQKRLAPPLCQSFLLFTQALTFRAPCSIIAGNKWVVILLQYTGAKLVMEILKENQIDTVFGYPGGAILPLYDELYTGGHGVRHIRGAHEQGCAHAADAYARVSGKTGVVFATSGPGATNLVTALATAQADSVPLVAITGNTSLDLLGKDSFQEVYIAGITMSITKHNFVVRDIRDLAPSLRRAFQIAQEGRRGVVLVDIPKNILTQTVPYTKPRAKKPPVYRAKKGELRKLAALLGKSKRPLLYFGGGVLSSGASGALASFCQRANLPACHTLMGIGALPANSPYNLGLAGMHGKRSVAKAIDECDLLVAVGTRFSDRVAFSGKDFAQEAKRVQIDIDDAEISKNIRISLGIQADAKDVLTALSDFVEPQKRIEWFARLRELQKTLDQPYPYADWTGLSPGYILSRLAEAAEDDAILVTDVGQHQIWTAQLYPFRHPGTFFTPGGLGTMGFGMGGTIGAKLAAPERQVFLITGDGSFHMDLTELATAVRYGLAVKVILMDNSSLGMVRQWQRLSYAERFVETDESVQTDFARLAQAFGAKGWTADTCDAFDQALACAMQSEGPCIIHCKIDKDFEVSPLLCESGEHIMMR